MDELRMHPLIRELKKANPCLDGYLLGLKHGITLAQLDEHYETQLAQIEEMRQTLKKCNGQES